MSLKYVALGVAVVAGISYLSHKGSKSLSEVLTLDKLPTPGSDRLEKKLAELKARFKMGGLPPNFDLDRWLDENWPRELAKFESWGKQSARNYLFSENISLRNAMSELRGSEKSETWGEMESSIQSYAPLHMKAQRS